MFVPTGNTYGPMRPFTGIALLFYMYTMFVPHRNTSAASTVCHGDDLTLLYSDGVHTSRETYLCASTACHADRFTFLCVYDVRTSRETQVLASTACHWICLLFICWSCSYLAGNTRMGLHGLPLDMFTFLYVDVRTSRETQVWASTACHWIGLLFYVLMMFVPHGKHT
jgi:hypothetical protein